MSQALRECKCFFYILMHSATAVHLLFIDIGRYGQDVQMKLMNPVVQLDFLMLVPDAYFVC